MCAVIPYRGFKSLSLRQGLKAFMHCIDAFIIMSVVFARKMVYNCGIECKTPHHEGNKKGRVRAVLFSFYFLFLKNSVDIYEIT